MPNIFKVNGLAELFEGLRTLPTELQAEGAEIVLANGDAAIQELRAAYPTRLTGLHPGPRRASSWFAPGQLKAKLFLAKRVGQFSTSVTVKNTDPIAWLYDHGSEARHWDGGKFTGRMPATHLFGRTMAARRRIMYDRLKDLVARKGLTVSGDA